MIGKPTLDEAELKALSHDRLLAEALRMREVIHNLDRGLDALRSHIQALEAENESLRRP